MLTALACGAENSNRLNGIAKILRDRKTRIGFGILYSFVKVGSALGVINKSIEVYSNGVLKTEKVGGYKIGQGEVNNARKPDESSRPKLSLCANQP